MKRILATLFVFSLLLTLVEVPIVVSASSGSNMEKVLYYYHKKNYKKAKTYNKKLGKYANEYCVKHMCSKMKKAYKKVLKGYHLDNEDSYGRYLREVYFSDIDNDKKSELLLVYGSCEIDATLRIYKYSNGKAKKIGETPCGHSTFYAYPTHKGIIRMYAHRGVEELSNVTLVRKKFEDITIGARYVPHYEEYFPLRQELRDYIKYTRKGNTYIDYSLLK